jgi:hypothetical protein
VAIGWSIASVSASNPPALSGEHAAEPRAPTGPFLSGPLTAMRTYLSRGMNFQALTGSFTPVEASKVKIACPGKTGSCLVSADINVAISSTNSNVELCVYVDGSATKTQVPCAANVGASSTTALYHSYSFVHTFKISHGAHKVQTHALVTNTGGTMSYYSIVYTVYKNAG